MCFLPLGSPLSRIMHQNKVHLKFNNHVSILHKVFESIAFLKWQGKRICLKYRKVQNLLGVLYTSL